LIFLTDRLTVPASAIAHLYWNRWQAELFFQWIQQHQRIKRFPVNSENALKTQAWCAIATCVLVCIVKNSVALQILAQHFSTHFGSVGFPEYPDFMGQTNR
jgi:IS4 transposase